MAADVLDGSKMPAYVQAVRRHARHRPRIWGLHNYIDANRFRTTGTRALLRAVPGRARVLDHSERVGCRVVAD